MRLRGKLLLLFLPLALVPLVFVTVVALFLVDSVTPNSLTQPYAVAAGIFVCLVGTVVVCLAAAIAHAISKPLKALTQDTLRVAEGDLQITMEVESDMAEVGQLTEAVCKMKTELRRQREALREEAANAAIGRVASHVAHDLVSPLSTMKAVLEHFRNGAPVDSRSAEHVNLLELSFSRLKGISQELLDYRKGKKPPRTVFSLHRLLDELIGEHQASGHFDCVKIVKQYHRKPLFLFGDRGKIQRVFANLVKNAMEAMDKCGTLTVTTAGRDEKTVVEIEDTGSGMSPELLAKVLQGGHTGGKKDGHGIGTTVIRQVLHEHGGVLTARSELSVGTVFTVTLPMGDSVRGACYEEEESARLFTLRVSGTEPILLIEDDPEFAWTWRQKLEQMGYGVIVCDCWEDFLRQKIEAAQTRTAVVDYLFHNSEKNGLEILKMLRNRGWKNLYLCTVEYWKPTLKLEAQRLGIKICPKPIPEIRIFPAEGESAAIVRGSTSSPRTVEDIKTVRPEPVEGRMETNSGYTILLVDDDEMIRLSWDLKKKQLGITRLFSFANLEELQRESGFDFTAVDAAFVDKNIEGSRFTGAETIRHLRVKGVQKIILASGENPAALKNDPRFRDADFITAEKIPDSFREFFC